MLRRIATFIKNLRYYLSLDEIDREIFKDTRVSSKNSEKRKVGRKSRK